ncbi:hypothetical protein DVH05_023461 [Phytophthora capsici]|nr:hypothetical protein DVH05_023461 [Phytophthora capsici]
MTRVTLTKAQQLELCKHHKKHPSCVGSDLAAWYQEAFQLHARPGKSTVNRILRKRDFFAA